MFDEDAEEPEALEEDYPVDIYGFRPLFREAASRWVTALVFVFFMLLMLAGLLL
jgi:hypothetical protein